MPRHRHVTTSRGHVTLHPPSSLRGVRALARGPLAPDRRAAPGRAVAREQRSGSASRSAVPAATMAALKQVNRCATTAFCPTAPLLAVGTMAGAVDLSFSTTACLEVRPVRRSCHFARCRLALRLVRSVCASARAQIFRLDLAHSTKRELAPAGGAVATTERFHRLAWSPSGVETGELPVRAMRWLASRCRARNRALTCVRGCRASAGSSHAHSWASLPVGWWTAPLTFGTLPKLLARWAARSPAARATARWWLTCRSTRARCALSRLRPPRVHAHVTWQCCAARALLTFRAAAH